MLYVPPDDLQSRIDALAAGTWTPELVQARLVEAIGVAIKTERRPGPRQFGNAMPLVLHEPPALGELAEWIRIRGEWEDAQIARANRPDGYAIARADEALHWPMRYLAAHPLQADALMLWALSKAAGVALAKLLRRRVIAADARVTYAKESGLPDKVTVYEDECAEIARRIALWTNAALEGEADPAKRQRIRHAGHIRFRREIAKAGAVVREVFVRRQDVVVGKVFTKTACDVHRKRGAAIVAAALVGDGVAVR